MPGKVLRIVRLTRFTVLLREREINERNETRRDEARRKGEGGRERGGGGGRIDQREKEGKERGASARPFGIPGPRRERRRIGDV